MEGYFPLRLKRKDLQDVSDDFSDFPLTAPARKSRRLDAELLPPIKEEESEIPIEFVDPFPNGQSYGSNPTGGIRIEELPDEPANEERAIVLFNPNITAPLLQSPSNFSVSIDPSIFSGLKNQLPWSNKSNPWRITDEEADKDNTTVSGNGCLAVVPWIPSQFSSGPVPECSSQTDNPDMMDAQEMEEATMEVEDTTAAIKPSNVTESIGVNFNEQFPQWQQQQCLFPQPPHGLTPPIVWHQ